MLFSATAFQQILSKDSCLMGYCVYEVKNINIKALLMFQVITYVGGDLNLRTSYLIHLQMAGKYVSVHKFWLHA